MIKEGQIRAFYLHALLKEEAQKDYPEWIFVYIVETDDVDGLVRCNLAHREFALIGRNDKLAVDSEKQYWVVIPSSDFYLSPDELEKFSIHETDATLYSLDTPDVIPPLTLARLMSIKPDYEKREDLLFTIPPALIFRPLATD